MEAYHIERLGSVDGIMLRSSEDPARAAGGPDAGAREFAELTGHRQVTAGETFLTNV